MATLLKEAERPRVHRWEARRTRRNVGGPERGIRLAVGVASAVGAAFVAPAAFKATLAALGAVGLFTGVSGYCPANRLAKRDSYHNP